MGGREGGRKGRGEREGGKEGKKKKGSMGEEEYKLVREKTSRLNKDTCIELRLCTCSKCCRGRYLVADEHDRRLAQTGHESWSRVLELVHVYIEERECV